jgi:hypothetical protein
MTHFSIGPSSISHRPLIRLASLLSCLLGTAYGTVLGTHNVINFEISSGQLMPGKSSPEQHVGRTKIAEGEYAIYEPANGGAVGPFGEEVYNFHESWALWRSEKGEYQVEGVREFESPKDQAHSNRFVVELTRDLTVIRMKEFARLRWRPDSGPLSCEFSPAALHCSSGGSDPSRTIQLSTHLEEPYGLLWPISPFSLSGVTRTIERDLGRATQVDFVRIEQPSRQNPVETTILAGPLRYLDEEDIEAAGRKWRAHKFSLKVAMHPTFVIWTSSNGLLLALDVEHSQQDWPKEGLKLERFQQWSDF